MKIGEKSDAQIKEIIERLGNALMAPKSHGYEKYVGKRIVEAAEEQMTELQDSQKNAAIAVMGVVLGANRDWQRQVAKHLVRMRADEAIKNITFRQLLDKLQATNYKDFKSIWGHSDEKKFDTLKSLVEQILIFGADHPVLNDVAIMKEWAETAKLENRANDLLGGLKNVGIATFQHLRMTFGVDTVKPDQRVKEVLKNEFGMRLSPEKAISAVEQIARITGNRVYVIDQIFVKYGSGYY